MRNRYKVILGFGVMIAVIWFVHKIIRSSEEMVCSDFSVEIVNSESQVFINTDELKASVKSQYNDIVGASMGEIDFERIRNIIAANPFVRKVVVYKSPDAVVKAEVEQREPLVRVFNSDGRSFIIDVNGDIMPVPSGQTLSLVCAGGQIRVHPDSIWGKNVQTLALDKNSSYRILNSVYLVAKGLFTDEIFIDLIAQIYVNDEQQLELYPALGNFYISFGMPNEINEKLNKLYIFYTQLFPNIDMNQYKKIDLTVANQLVLQKNTII